LRLTTEGWNVRFMVGACGRKKPYIRARYWRGCQWLQAPGDARVQAMCGCG
jgi:hypothetical protein